VVRICIDCAGLGDWVLGGWVGLVSGRGLPSYQWEYSCIPTSPSVGPLIATNQPPPQGPPSLYTSFPHGPPSNHGPLSFALTVCISAPGLDVSAWSPGKAAASSTPARGLLHGQSASRTWPTTPAMDSSLVGSDTHPSRVVPRSNMLTVSAYAEEESELYFAVSVPPLLSQRHYGLCGRGGSAGKWRKVSQWWSVCVVGGGG